MNTIPSVPSESDTLLFASHPRVFDPLPRNIARSIDLDFICHGDEDEINHLRENTCHCPKHLQGEQKDCLNCAAKTKKRKLDAICEQQIAQLAQAEDGDFRDKIVTPDCTCTCVGGMKVCIRGCTAHDLMALPEKATVLIEIVNRRLVWIMNKLVEIFDIITSWDIAEEFCLIHV